MKKISRNIAMALCLSLALSSAALAQGHNKQMHKGEGHPAMNLTETQRATYDKIMEEYEAKVTPLRDLMWAQHVELKALSANPKTEPATISKMVQNMSETRVKLRAERKALGERLEKELGIKKGHWRRGMMGGGMMGGGMMNDCDGMGGGMGEHGMGSGMGEHGMGHGKK